MPNIARTTPRPPVRAAAAASKTKILLVRQPVKSVRKSDEADLTMLRLLIGVLVGLGSLGAIWLLGYIGFRLGFSHLVRVPDQLIEGSGGLTTGVMMLISAPRVILEAGIAEPMWLMLGFLLIAIPAASLGAIKPTSPGGPRPKKAVVTLSYSGAIIAGLNALTMVAWTVSPLRSQHVSQLPVDPAQVDRWLAELQTVAGLDVIGTVSAALWVVVAMKLAIPRWLRGLIASACIFALVVIAVAMSMTNATIAQSTSERPVCTLDSPASAGPQLILGFTPRSVATLRIDGNTSLVDLRDRPSVMTASRIESIVEFMREQTPREQ